MRQVCFIVFERVDFVPAFSSSVKLFENPETEKKDSAAAAVQVT